MKLKTILISILWGIFLALALLAVATTPVSAGAGKPSIAIGDVTISPSALMPGDTGTVTITLANPAQSLSGDTTTTSRTYSYGAGESNGLATPSHTDQTTTQSSSVPDGAVMLKEVTLRADSPIHVVSPYQFLDVGRLGMGNSYKFTFTVKADDNAANGAYFLTLKARTGDGDVYLNYPIAISVDDTPVNISVSDSPRSFTSAEQTVTLDIVNNRNGEVSGVAVLPAGDEFGFNPMQYVIGTVGAGEAYTAQFDVTADNASYTGDPSFKVVYKNGDNWHESPAVIASSHHGTAAAAASFDWGSGPALYVAGLIAVLALVFGGVFLYQRRKRPGA